MAPRALPRHARPAPACSPAGRPCRHLLRSGLPCAGRRPRGAGQRRRSQPVQVPPGSARRRLLLPL